MEMADTHSRATNVDFIFTLDRYTATSGIKCNSYLKLD